MVVDSPVLLLASRDSNAWDFANRIYDKLAHHEDSRRKYKLGEVSIDYHPDKEVKVEILRNVREHECYFIHDSTMNPQDWKESLLQVNEALRLADAAEITDVLPYMCYSRQDTVSGRTPISAALLAANIIDSGAKRVITSDLHNAAIRGFYRSISFENLKIAYKVIIDFLKEHEHGFLEKAVVSPPDEGATKRNRGFGKRLGLRSIYFDKGRDESDEIIEMNIVGDIKGKNALIVDDMTSTAGTICKAAYVLKENGAEQIYVVVTHGVLCKDKDGREAIDKINESPIEKIIMTDSVPRKSDGKTVVIPISDFFGEVIKAITHRGSVTKLYES